MKTAAFLLLLATPLAAAEMRVHRDVRYAESPHSRHKLDVYAPRGGDGHPVVVWIHGGGWRQGDKSGVQRKPDVFVENGFVFVSVNHRLRPEVTVSEMTGDIAAAIKWVHDHIGEYGGSPEMICVAGHSSGAHLAALVCTDERYLKQAGLALDRIQGCIPLDVSVYDIPKRLKDGGSVPPERFTAIFGESQEVHRELSPVHHVERGKGIPPFLILHVAEREDTGAQSEWFAKALKKAGVVAEVVAAEGKTHGTISTDIGLPDDELTRRLFDFLQAVSASPDPPKQP